jgi:hypothetical protein
MNGLDLFAQLILFALSVAVHQQGGGAGGCQGNGGLLVQISTGERPGETTQLILFALLSTGLSPPHLACVSNFNSDIVFTFLQMAWISLIRQTNS